MRWLWNKNIPQNQFRFQRGCDLTKESLKCVQNTGVCDGESFTNAITHADQKFCEALPQYMKVTECMNSWIQRKELQSELLTNGDVLAACDQHELRHLALEAVKLNLYMMIPTYQSDFHAQLTGRYLCKMKQRAVCLAERHDKLCPGYQPFAMLYEFGNKDILEVCETMTPSGGVCAQFEETYCPIDSTTGEINMKMDVADITHIYDMVTVHKQTEKQVFLQPLFGFVYKKNSSAICCVL